MCYASWQIAGNVTGNEKRNDLLLESVTYPNHASTQFAYERKISIENTATLNCYFIHKMFTAYHVYSDH